MENDQVQRADDLARGVHVTPGPGIVARLGNFVAFARGDEDGLNQLIVRLNALADAQWPEVVRTLTSDIAAAGYDAHPPLACASIQPNRVGALVFGDLKLSISTDREERVLDGADSSTWIDVAVHGEAHRLRCGEQSMSAVVGVLRDGVVPAGGFVLDLHGPIPAATRWDNQVADEVDDAATKDDAEPSPQLQAVPDEEPAPEEVASDDDPVLFSASIELANEVEESVETVDAAKDAEEVAELTVVEAVIEDSPALDTADDGEESVSDFALTQPSEADALAGSFFSRPGEDGRLEVTREAIAYDDDPDIDIDTSFLVDDVPPQPEPLPPPPELEPDSLGVLTFDDGAQLQLVRPVVIGRGVPDHYTIDGIPATTVLLDDAQGLISPVHLEVHLEDGAVQLIDMSSASGTFTRPDGDTEARAQLPPEQVTLIHPGTVVEIGYRSFTFTR